MVLSHYFQLLLIVLQPSLTPFSLFFFNQTLFPSFAPPPSFTFFHSAASLVSLLGYYVPSLPLFNLIKENAMQLSSSWLIASFFPYIILLFINTIWLPIRHTAHVISRDGCGGTCDNDVFFSYLILAEVRLRILGHHFGGALLFFHVRRS